MRPLRWVGTGLELVGRRDSALGVWWTFVRVLPQRQAGWLAPVDLGCRRYLVSLEDGLSESISTGLSMASADAWLLLFNGFCGAYPLTPVQETVMNFGRGVPDFIGKIAKLRFANVF